MPAPWNYRLEATHRQAAPPHRDERTHPKVSNKPPLRSSARVSGHGRARPCAGHEAVRRSSETGLVARRTRSRRGRGGRGRGPAPTAWCTGPRPVGGRGVPLAVTDRSAVVTSLDVLCAYLRLPYPPPAAATGRCCVLDHRRLSTVRSASAQRSAGLAAPAVEAFRAAGGAVAQGDVGMASGVEVLQLAAGADTGDAGVVVQGARAAEPETARGHRRPSRHPRFDVQQNRPHVL